MNTLDIVIVAVVALLTLFGLRKGFIVSLATLAGLLLGIYLAIHFSHYTAGVIARNFHPSSFWLPGLAYTATFLVVLIGIYFIGRMVEKLVEMAGMSVLNHIGGALLGFAKGVLIMSAALYLIALADPNAKMVTQSTKDRSMFYRPVAAVVPMLLKMTDKQIDR
jgi:membrane protein required for colicin V production